MKKLNCFTTVDLLVVVGLIMVLTGASLVMIGSVFKNKRDSVRIANADKIYQSLTKYYDANFKSFPMTGVVEGSPYRSVILGKENDAFLQAALPDEIKSLPQETAAAYGYVYVYSTDGQKAGIIVRRLESGRKRCNTSAQAPEIIKDYLTKDPLACYYKATADK